VRALLLVWLLLAACGPTIGDPCTTAQDCLGRTCLNGNGIPGGYCSLSCVLNDANSCPTGSKCVKDGIAKDVHGCYRRCFSTRDCRAGYDCSSEGVCVGPGGP
jgi:hypothetical protein